MGRPKKVKKVVAAVEVAAPAVEPTPEVILEVSEAAPQEVVEELAKDYAVVVINSREYKRWTDANGVTYTEPIGSV